MIELTTEELKQRFSDSIFKRISETADDFGETVSFDFGGGG